MSNRKILVVDDDSVMRFAYQVFLKAHNYETCFAADAMAAISEARKSRPDLVILDLGLPAGGGHAVLERFRANLQLALIPIIVVSASDRAANEEKALKAGARAFLPKPWNDKELLETIRKFTGEPEPSGAPA